MNHEERLAGLDRYALANVISLAQDKMKKLDEASKSEYYVVQDDFMNLAFFRKDDLKGALAFFIEEAGSNGALREVRDYLQIKVERWFDDEVKDLVKEKI